MKRVWPKIGTTLFWLSWPALWLYLRFSERTRVLVVHGGKVLVVRTWLGNGKWSLPGGGLHRHEPPVQGVLRELQEETGIVLTSNQLHELVHERYSDKGFYFDCHFFLAETLEQLAVQRQKGEITAAKWVDYPTLNPLNANAEVLYTLGIWHGKA